VHCIRPIFLLTCGGGHWTFQIEEKRKATIKQIPAGVLGIVHFDRGSSKGIPVLLLHGFPCDVHSYDEDFKRTAISFENPDFVDVVIKSYRHRFGLVPGDASVEETERRLTKLPAISAPSIVLYRYDDGVAPLGGSEDHRHFFTGEYEHRVIRGAGHNLPQEAPQKFAVAVLSAYN
jgi:pimeloyl-ACP methyl ester carboxylesterase